ncbi:MAG: hypothetical protein WBC59_01335, partial [Phycisphaerae bacterium]
MIHATKRAALVPVCVLVMVSALPAADTTTPQTATSPSGACLFEVPEGWKMEQVTTQNCSDSGKTSNATQPSTKPAEAGFAMLVPASWPWESADDQPQPFIQVHEIPGPVPSADLVRKVGPAAGMADTAMLVLQLLAAEQGFKVFPVKNELRDISGRLALYVCVKGPQKDGPYVMEEIFILAENEDSWFGVVTFYHQKMAERCDKAFSQVVNSLRPIKAVPRPQAGEINEKLEYLAEILKKGNATEQAPWSMAVLGLALWRKDAKDAEDTLLIHLRFLNPNCQDICQDWAKVLNFVKNGTDFEPTESCLRFNTLMSAHAGALSLEVARKDIKTSKAVFVIYGENQERVAAYQTNLDT